MEYTDALTVAVTIITIIGLTLGSYVTYKIYSKDGFR